MDYTRFLMLALAAAVFVVILAAIAMDGSSGSLLGRVLSTSPAPTAPASPDAHRFIRGFWGS